MILGAYNSFSATGRIFDNKYGNSDTTEETKISLKSEPGGSIQILQPNQDLDLYVKNAVDVFFRTLDYVEATEEAITVLKKDASKVVEAVGREGIEKKVKEVLMEKLSEELPESIVSEKTILKSDEFRNITMNPEEILSITTESILNMAMELGVEGVKTSIEVLEGAGLVALTPVTGGVSFIVHEALNITQMYADGHELEILLKDFKSCMNGNTLVKLRCIIMPDSTN